MKGLHFLKSIGVAALGGAASGAAGAASSCGADIQAIATQAAVGAVLTAAAYLKQSPIPPSSGGA